jgi:hypothetical protein
MSERWIKVVQTTWDEMPKAHTINNALALFDDADPHPRTIRELGTPEKHDSTQAVEEAPSSYARAQQAGGTLGPVARWRPTDDVAADTDETDEGDAGECKSVRRFNVVRDVDDQGHDRECWQDRVSE